MMTYKIPKSFMKQVILLILCFTPLSICSQTSLNDILKNISWPCTETTLVKSLQKNITPTQQNTWESENTESNYCFKGVSIGGFPIAKSYIRVKQDSKELFRLNFIVLHNETDLTLYPKVEADLVKQFGTPIKNEEKSIWTFEKYKIEASFTDISNVMTEEIEKYVYAVNVEPIRTYHVDWTKAIVESNNARSTIPQIEYFRIDNDDNVYIKEKDTKETQKEKNRIIPTPNGDVITFEGGMFCYRPLDNDIVFIKSGMAITYPITKY